MRSLWLIPLLLPAIVWAQTNVLTANGNNQRTNTNLEEFRLSPRTVNSAGFGKIGSYGLDGQSYTQPLYVNGISVPALGQRNLILTATMHNSVYAFDADSLPDNGRAIWQVNLGTPAPSQTVFGTPYSDIANEIGVLGTGTVDLERGVLYLVSENMVNGSLAFLLHALDLGTGAERLNGPVQIRAASGGINFDPRQHLQRPGLLLSGGAVYVGFGSHADQSPWHGWLMSYDAGDLRNLLGVFLTSSTGNGGAIWQSGRGLAEDLQGRIYALTGNGDYDGAGNYSQSFLRLKGTAPQLDAWYTPADWQDMSDNDFDLAAGPAIVPSTGMILGGDKAGYAYAIGASEMGRSVEPDPGLEPYFYASTGSIFNLAVWDRPNAAMVFLQGSQDTLKSFALNGGGMDETPLSAAVVAQRYSRVGMTISAAGYALDSGIVWETSGDFNDLSVPGVLHAFQASDLSVELWNSSINSNRDELGAIAKFVNPTVANGRVYVATFANRIDVYGLLQDQDADLAAPSIATIGSSANYLADAIAPGEMLSIFGANLGPAAGALFTLNDQGAVPAELAGTRVLFDGSPAPVLFAGTNQVNTIAPFGLSGDTTQVTVEYHGQPSDPVAVPLTEASPAVFSADGSGSGQAMALNEDGSANGPEHPAAPGSVVVIYATGLGAMSGAASDGTVAAGTESRPLLPVSAQVGGLTAQVLYVGGAPGMVQGLVQVNLQVPAGVAAGDAVAVKLQAGSQASTSATIAVGARDQ